VHLIVTEFHIQKTIGDTWQNADVRNEVQTELKEIGDLIYNYFDERMDVIYDARTQRWLAQIGHFSDAMMLHAPPLFESYLAGPMAVILWKINPVDHANKKLMQKKIYANRN
jgi:hypothetical protein